MKNRAGTSDTKGRRAAIFRIQTDTIGEYLGEEDHPLFIAVLRKDAGLMENLKNLEEVAEEFRKDGLIVCYTLEDLLPYFTIRFNVGGTPTFLMIISGIVLGTMLGKNSGAALISFIHDHLQEYRTSGKPEQSVKRKGTEKDLPH